MKQIPTTALNANLIIISLILHAFQVALQAPILISKLRRVWIVYQSAVHVTMQLIVHHALMIILCSTGIATHHAQLPPSSTTIMKGIAHLANHNVSHV